MPYSAEISRDHPAAFLFVIDQSGSMDERPEGGRMKSEFVADVLNKTVYTLVTNCSKADGVRNYFDIGVIGYGGAGERAWRIAVVRRSPPDRRGGRFAAAGRGAGAGGR